MGDEINFRMWEITKQHMGENGATVAVELQDPDGWFDANVRWDGMMELHVYHNVPKGEKNERGDQFIDTLHLADIDGMIRRLEELKAVCQHLFDFRNSWAPEPEAPDEYQV
ncbi:MAG: hypothetical protein ACXVDB_02900 [Tumebacillaceae bacterium]